VRLEGLGKLKKFTLSGTRTGDLPACSVVPQPTTLPRAPRSYTLFILYFGVLAKSLNIGIRADVRCYTMTRNAERRINLEILFPRQWI
jgi:hypothetical protein